MKSFFKVLVVAGSVFFVGCATQQQTNSSPGASGKTLSLKKSTHFLRVNGIKKHSPTHSSHKQKIQKFPTAAELNLAPCSSGNFSLKDLAIYKLGISNQEHNTVVSLLALMGYKAVALTADAAADPVSLSCDELPFVVKPIEPKDKKLSVVRGEGEGASEDAGSNLKIRHLAKNNSAEVDELLVFYHPEKLKALKKLIRLVKTKIDVPSPQVYIETMVVEINEEDSRELGITYSSINANQRSMISIGQQTYKGGDPLIFNRNTKKDSSGNFVFTPGSGFQVQLRALVEKGKAEILSRPSVMTLSNRQAVIQIVDILQTPKVESSFTGGEVVLSSFTFEPLQLGITLNLRPRVSADRKWVSLEIDANVESENEENDGQVFAPQLDKNGERVLLGEKRGSSTRKVRTFARIPDRMPIVIGGLVARKNEKGKTRVPLLGEIPFFGGLFGATDNEKTKRELIIVLTPHILAEDAVSVRTQKPGKGVMKNDDLTLFASYHKIRQHDLYDLSTVYRDPYYRAYQDKVRKAIKKNPTLAYKAPYKNFIGGNIPGGNIVVNKTMFDIMRSKGKGLRLNPAKVLLGFDSSGSMDKAVNLSDLLKQVNWKQNEALLLSFENGNKNAVISGVSYKVVKKPSDKSWQQFRNELGVLPGKQKILLQGMADVERLLTAVMTVEFIQMNGGSDFVTVSRLREGQLLKLPSTKKTPVFLLNKNVARVYQHSDRFFIQMLRQITLTYKKLDLAGNTY